jgi:hypothetical protein
MLDNNQQDKGTLNKVSNIPETFQTDKEVLKDNMIS